MGKIGAGAPRLAHHNVKTGRFTLFHRICARTAYCHRLSCAVAAALNRQKIPGKCAQNAPEIFSLGAR
jgi:hypothetical protein